MEVKINELTHQGMDKLAQLAQELIELRRRDGVSIKVVLTKELEIYKLISDRTSEYATKKQIECEI